MAVGTEQHDAAWLEMGQCTRGLRARSFIRFFPLISWYMIPIGATTCRSVRLPVSEGWLWIAGAAGAYRGIRATMEQPSAGIGLDHYV